MHAEAHPRRDVADEGGLGLAIALAIGVHVLLALVLWFGAMVSWERKPLSVAGAPSMEASLDVSAADLRAVSRALQFEPEPMPDPAPEPEPLPAEPEEATPPPQPLPEPRPEQAEVERQPAPQERIPDPAPVDQEEVRRDADRERARIAREQEEKRRQQQIELDAQKQKDAEEKEKQRLALQQADEQRKRDELARVQKEREKADNEVKRREQQMQQIADSQNRPPAAQPRQGQAATPPPGNQGGDEGLRGRYRSALMETILRNWTRPDSVPLGQTCRIYITQIPGGEVINVEFDASCPYDALGRRSVEAAVRKAEPLPYRGYETVFNRRLNLNFTPQDR